MTLTTRLATATDLPAVADLFDQYRQFYRQPGDLPRARRYLAARLERGESVLIVAETTPGALVGFCQLYPSFCSLLTDRTFVLYDLFVAPGARRLGAGRALLLAAEDHAREAGAVRLELSTARDNLSAQALYESLGWRRDEHFFVYQKSLRPGPAQ